jgi:cupin 2 domain-containing protein
LSDQNSGRDEGAILQHGNIFSQVDADGREEQFQDLAAWPGARIERIVSTGQATPAGEWLDQPTDEWVLLAAGSAALRFADAPGVHVLKPGDWILIPAATRHRVEWTGAEPTIWVAIHVAA